MGPVFFGIKLDATKCHDVVVIFVDTLQGSFQKNRVNRRHVLPGGLGDFFPAGLCGSLLVSMTKVSTGRFPKKDGCDQTDHPQKGHSRAAQPF